MEDDSHWLSMLGVDRCDNLQVISSGFYPSPHDWLKVSAVKDYTLIFPIDRTNKRVSLGRVEQGNSRAE